jgi:hypothetical protein
VTEPSAIRFGLEGYSIAFPLALSILAESEGYKPADFDRLIDISEQSGSSVEIDENTAGSHAGFHPVPAAGVR